MKQSYQKKSTIDTIVDAVVKNSGSGKEEATECLLRSFLNKYEDAFVSVAMDKCVISKKFDENMDVIRTEAMIQEANITTNSARIISRHLRLHFGKSLFASESEHRTYFAGSDFPQKSVQYCVTR